MANNSGTKTGKSKPKYARGKNPNSLKNLQGTMQVAGQPAINPSGRPKGSPNRATIVERYMNLPIDVRDPSSRDVTATIRVSLYEAAMLGQFRAAMNGNTKAWKEIQDALHGKQKETVEVDLSGTVGVRVIEPGDE